MDLVYDACIKVGEDKVRVLGEHIRLHVQPKPRWLPRSVWHRTLKRLLVLKMFNERGL